MLTVTDIEWLLLVVFSKMRQTSDVYFKPGFYFRI